MNQTPADPGLPRQARPRRRRHRILQATAVLPSFATVLNGLSGFAAIYFATKLGLGQSKPQVINNLTPPCGDAVHNLTLASGLIFLAMVFDLLDGRLARMTRRTSDFGAGSTAFAT